MDIGKTSKENTEIKSRIETASLDFSIFKNLIPQIFFLIWFRYLNLNVFLFFSRRTPAKKEDFFYTTHRSLVCFSAISPERNTMSLFPGVGTRWRKVVAWHWRVPGNQQTMLWYLLSTKKEKSNFFVGTEYSYLMLWDRFNSFCYILYS